MLVHRTARADGRVDLAILNQGSALVARLLKSCRPSAEACLGGACAGALLSAMAAAVAPGMPAPGMLEIHNACVALEAVLRWGAHWPTRDAQRPDSRQHIARSWAAFCQRLAQVCPLAGRRLLWCQLLFLCLHHCSCCCYRVTLKLLSS